MTVILCRADDIINCYFSQPKLRQTEFLLISKKKLFYSSSFLGSVVNYEYMIFKCI